MLKEASKIYINSKQLVSRAVYMPWNGTKSSNPTKWLQQLILLYAWDSTVSKWSSFAEWSEGVDEKEEIALRTFVP